MKFYHGTRNGDLKELNFNHHSGKIYITDSFAMAFLYAANPIRFWAYNREKDKLIIREVKKDGLKTMYKGKKCYIFEFECDDFVKFDSTNPSNHTYMANKPIKLEKCEVIEDAYKKLCELEKEDKIIVQHWEDFSKEEQNKITKNVFTTFNKDVMKEEKKFPESYKQLINLFPELEVKE